MQAAAGKEAFRSGLNGPTPNTPRRTYPLLWAYAKSLAWAQKKQVGRCDFFCAGASRWRPCPAASRRNLGRSLRACPDGPQNRLSRRPSPSCGNCFEENPSAHSGTVAKLIDLFIESGTTGPTAVALGARPTRPTPTPQKENAKSFLTMIAGKSSPRHRPAPPNCFEFMKLNFLPMAQNREKPDLLPEP